MVGKIDFKRVELRMIWEAKCLDPSPAAIAGRRAEATRRLLARGTDDPSPTQVDRERHALEEERFIVWLTEKRINGFDRT